jgi:hypothetical protein
MIRTKQKNLSKLLQRALSEEAQNIDPPSCQQLWTELQQRPEFTTIEKKAEQFFLTQGNKRKGFQAFWKKHQYLAALITAGFFIAVLLTRLTPFMGQEPTLQQEQISAPEAGLQNESMEKEKDGAVSFSVKSYEKTPLESFSLRSTVEEALPAQPPEPAKGPAEEEQAGHSTSTFDLWEQKISQPEKQISDSRLGRNLQPSPEEQTFEEEESFLQALKEARQLTDEEIWQVRSLPDNYIFQEGKIIQTEASPLIISQEFTGEEDRGFTLLQQFIQDEAGIEDRASVATAQSPAQPIQVGPYCGYLFRPSPGLCTLTWLQEESLVTLSGQLEEEMLFKIIAALENPPRSSLE